MASKKKPAKEKNIILRNEQGATVLEMQAGKAIADRVPEVVQAYADYSDASSTANSKFWTFCDVLRKPVGGVPAREPAKDPVTGVEIPGFAAIPPRPLNGREVTLLMLSLGLIKQRATEYKAIAEMPVAHYEFCREKAISKDLSLKVAWGSVEVIEAGGKVTAIKPPEKKAPSAPAKPVKAKFHKFPKGVQAALLIACEAPELKATNDEIPYETEIALADGREFKVIIFVDAKPVKE